jgi:hypothetical protein
MAHTNIYKNIPTHKIEYNLLQFFILFIYIYTIVLVIEVCPSGVSSIHILLVYRRCFIQTKYVIK